MKYFYLILMLLTFSCGKKETKTPTLKNQIEELTSLKNYKIVSKKKINDSIEYIKGENKYFTIDGDLNIKRNKKTSWWTVKQKNKDKSLVIQYLIFGKESFKNQILFYNKNVIDTAVSKFYSVKKNKDSLKIYFHSPQSDNYVFDNAFFGLRVIKNREIIRKDSIVLKNYKGNYYANILLKDKDVDEIGGFFSEVTTRKKNENEKELAAGINTIYVFNEIIK